jgi:SAM-dependent methyltransferase
LAALKSSDRILDVAAGPGTLALLAAPQVAQVDATDFSPGMIEQLQKLAQQAGVHNVQAQVMDAGALNFPNATFDAAFCMFGFMMFPDRAQAFREMKRVLRPGGRAFVATWTPIADRPLMKLAFDALAAAAPDLPPPLKGDLQTSEDCIREMTEAGFTEVQPVFFTGSARVESPSAYVEFMVRGGAPFDALRKKLGEEKWRPIHERMMGFLAREIPEGGITLGGKAIISLATA